MTAPHYFLYPFGEFADDLTSIPDAAPPDGSVSYSDGWTSLYELNLLTNPSALPIPRGQMNQLFYDITNNIQEYQQYGAPQWYSGVSYPIYSRVYYSNLVYESQIASNTNTPGTDDTWMLISGNAGGVPTGTILDFGGNSAPSGYLLCDGTVYNITDHPNLFAAISNIWGGDGITTFAVPNLARRVCMGSGGTASSVIPPGISNTVGSIGGEEMHTPTISEMASHHHSSQSGNFLIDIGAGGNIAVNAGGNAVDQSTTADTGVGNPFNIIQSAAIVLKIIKT